MRHTSTPASRNAARDRVTRLDRFEKTAVKLAQGAKLRIQTSKATPYALVTAGMLLGSLNWK